MNTLELMPTEENLIRALDEDILQRNKDLVYFYDLLMAQETAGAIAIDGRWGSGKTFFVKQSLLLINAKNPRCEMKNDKKDRILCCVPFRKDNDGSDENYDCDLIIFKGNISCYILLLKSLLTLENTKFIADELSLKFSLVLYLPIGHYEP